MSKKNVISDEVKKLAAEGWLLGEYKSKSACAKAFGVSTRTLGRALDKWFTVNVDKAKEIVTDIGDKLEELGDKHESAIIVSEDANVSGVIDENAVVVEMEMDTDGIIEPIDIESTPELDPVDPAIEWDYTVTRDSVTLFDKTNDKDYVGSGLTQEEISKVIYHIQNEEYADVIAMIDMGETISSYTEGHLTVCGDSVTFNGFVLDSRINERIVAACRGERGNLMNIMRMFSKLLQHNDRRIIEELYSFIEHNDIEIDSEGDLIAWKVITRDWKDCHTKTIDNSIGATPEMPRTMVNDNKHDLCSAGLHVCARSYISSFRSGSDRLVKVKLDPTDVVSVPTDYKGAKLRACKYTVMEEVKSL